MRVDNSVVKIHTGPELQGLRAIDDGEAVGVALEDVVDEEREFHFLSNLNFSNSRKIFFCL